MTADASGVASGVSPAIKAFEQLETSAAGSAQGVSASLDKTTASAGAASGKLDATTRSFINSIQRQTAAVEAGGRSNSEYFRALASQRGIDGSILEPYLRNLQRVETEAKQAKTAVEEFTAATRLTQGLSQAARVRVADDPVARGLSAAGFQARNTATIAAASATDRLTDATRRGAVVFNEYGLSARQTQAALRQVPAQLTDIVVSLQGGQNPLTVFLQQGGQLRDVFGGAVPALRALGGAVLGLINPFTLAATAVGVLSAGYFFGSREADNYAKSLILTGNAAGSTVDELSAIAAAVGATVGTQGAAAAALAQVAGTGEVAAGSLEKVTLAAVQLERTAGVAVEDTVKQFAELGKSPSEAAARLNQQYRFLTGSVYEQIKALEQQGRATEAAKVAQDAFADSLLNRSDELERRLGSIERGWLFVKDAIKGAADALLNIGRVDTIGQQIASLQSARDALLRGASPEEGDGITESAQREITAIEARIAVLQKEQGVRTESARIEGERAAITEAAIKAQDEIEKIRKQSASNQEKLNKALEEYRRNLDAIRKAEPNSAFLDPKKIANDEKNIREQFRDKSSTSDRGAGKAGADASLDAVRRSLSLQVSAYKDAESLLEAIRASGIVNEKEYYDAKREFVQLNVDAQERALNAEIAVLQKRNAEIAGDTKKAKERIDNESKIADLQTKIATNRATASTQATILNLKEQSSVASLAKAYEEARLSAQQLLDAQNLTQNRDIAGRGQGPQARELQQGRNQISDRYEQERQRIESERQLLRIQQEGNLTTEQATQFERRLELNRSFQDAALASYEDYYRRLRELDGDFTVGASEALNIYLENARNVAQQTQDLLTNAFKGMEDALVQFVQTGKLDFKSLADSIVADLLRIIIRQQLANLVAAASPFFKPGSGGVGGFIGDVFGALVGGGAPGRASGGDVEAGQAYTVGEFGRELFVPRTAGTIIPATETARMMNQRSTVNNITVNVPQGTNRQSGQQIAAEISRKLAAAGARGN